MHHLLSLPTLEMEAPHEAEIQIQTENLIKIMQKESTLIKFLIAITWSEFLLTWSVG